jgi:uncharacterized protein YndB with AHSA1/START domain
MDPTKTSTRMLQKRLGIGAPAAAVFKALTDAGDLARWFPTSAETDPRPEGAYVFRFESAESPERSRTHTGKFLEVTPPKRVSYTWRAPLAGQSPDAADAPETRVEFVLAEKAGQTEVVLTHSGFGHGADWDRSLEEHAEGWGFFVMNLRSWLERGVDTRARDRGLIVPRAAGEEEV